MLTRHEKGAFEKTWSCALYSLTDFMLYGNARLCTKLANGRKRAPGRPNSPLLLNVAVLPAPALRTVHRMGSEG